MGSGGTIEEITDILHEDTKKICIEAVKSLHLRFAGIDIISTDPSVSLRENGGIILEVNATPGLSGIAKIPEKSPEYIILKKLFSL